MAALDAERYLAEIDVEEDIQKPQTRPETV